MTMRQAFVLFAFVSTALILALSVFSCLWLWFFVLLGPIMLIGFYDMFQTKHSIRRLYSVFGGFRYLLESIRPEIQQYFVEPDTSGVPIAREFRSLIYQRAKGARDTRPFGTIFNVNRSGYEWMSHSMQPKHSTGFTPRIKFGGKPVGFKLRVGRRDEFLGICKAIIETDITPDFITVDGGGTGAAPTDVQSYAQLYPTVEPSALLDDRAMPDDWRCDMLQVNAAYW